MRTQTSSSAPLAMKAWKVSSASRWWRLASIILARHQRTHSRNSPAGYATNVIATGTSAKFIRGARRLRTSRCSAERIEHAARPQLSGHAPASFRMTEQALPRREEGLRAQREQMLRGQAY